MGFGIPFAVFMGIYFYYIGLKYIVYMLFLDYIPIYEELPIIFYHTL